MHWLAIEHSPAAYRADFYVYAAVLVAIGVALLAGPLDLGLLAWIATGAWAWTLVEYLVHRFVLHGLAPFTRWHAEHHRRPTALIAAPTLLSASIFANLLLPTIWLLGARPAGALTFGLLSGYLAYGLIHHAIHRPMPARVTSFGRRWLLKRRLWHGLHHRRMHAGPRDPAATVTAAQGYYGVTGAFWDRVFRTDRRITSPACRSSPR